MFDRLKRRAVVVAGFVLSVAGLYPAVSLELRALRRPTARREPSKACGSWAINLAA